MRASASAMFRACLATFALTIATGFPAQAQVETFTPVTDAVLQNPAPADWLMWRRTLDGWGYSPLDQIDRENVDALRMVWSRALGPGLQQGTPLVYNGMMYMPNPRDVIQAIDAVTGDLKWEYRRDLPDDLADYLIASIMDTNRNLAIYGNLIIDTSVDDYETLLSGVNPDAEVVLLDADRDGVEQIAEALAGREGFDAIHIVSHGNQGELRLGNDSLTFDSMLGEHADELEILEAYKERLTRSDAKDPTAEAADCPEGSS